MWCTGMARLGLFPVVVPIIDEDFRACLDVSYGAYRHIRPAGLLTDAWRSGCSKGGVGSAACTSAIVDEAALRVAQVFGIQNAVAADHEEVVAL